MSGNIDKVAWIHVVDGKVLGARSKGKDTWYFPGGKRETGETDEQTLIREIEEELSVRIKPESIRPFGRFEAAAHGKAEGVNVVMTCLSADYEGELAPAAEIEELGWLDSSDRDKVSAVSRLIFDRLQEMKLLS
ncbi:NUDIX hydrolase [Paenibacillus tepidiphilus]|uniref:NUDIX hydrolase n=1 Tax=Paenibacillus tepidiphilus TaxID=2608683 RepID=UPI0012389C26|nr:NUDIX domain-containing protein [Paenibacillus tepidiphilus]